MPWAGRWFLWSGDWPGFLCTLLGQRALYQITDKRGPANFAAHPTLLSMGGGGPINNNFTTHHGTLPEYGGKESKREQERERDRARAREKKREQQQQRHQQQQQTQQQQQQQRSSSSSSNCRTPAAAAAPAASIYIYVYIYMYTHACTCRPLLRGATRLRGVAFQASNLLYSLPVW